MKQIRSSINCSHFEVPARTTRNIILGLPHNKIYVIGYSVSCRDDHTKFRFIEEGGHDLTAPVFLMRGFAQILFPGKGILFHTSRVNKNIKCKSTRGLIKGIIQFYYLKKGLI